jgi:hypothetical protein
MAFRQFFAVQPDDPATDAVTFISFMDTKINEGGKSYAVTNHERS